MFITKKGAIHISHVSLLESNLEKGEEQGVLFNKSQKNYTRVSLLTLRDSIEEEKPNPKYLLLRNADEIREAFEAPLLLRHIDGIILSSPFYSAYLDKVAHSQDLDFLFLNQELSKNLDQEINVSELLVQQEEGKGDNPFAGIIKEQDKEKDDFLERLKNINLDTQGQGERGGQQQQQIDSLAQSIISSPQSSTKTYSQTQTSSGGENMYSQQGGKKSAIQMLASSVIANDQKPIVEEQRETAKEHSHFVENVKAEELQEASPDTLSGFAQSFEESQNLQQGQELAQQRTHIEVHERDTIVESTNSLDISRYDSILATTLITQAPLSSDAHFLDASQSETTSTKQAYVLVNSEEEMTNREVEYIIAANVCKGRSKKGSVLINTPKDFFSVFPKQQKVMLNLVALEPFMKKRMLDKCIEEFELLSGIILYKEDLSLLAEQIQNIKAVYVKDLEQDSQVQEVKEELLKYEKEYLMRR
jgi:hypothetical protein